MLKTIESIKKALDKIANADTEYANTEYVDTKYASPEPTNYSYNNNSRNEIHHYHHNSPSYMPFFMPSSGSNVVNNYYNGRPSSSSSSSSSSKKEEKKEKKEADAKDIVIASVALAGVALSATYFATQDEYIKYLMSNLDSLITEFDNYDDQIARNIVRLYKKWNKKYTTRTFKKLVTKSGGIISSGSIIYGGIVIGATSTLLLGGIAGLAASGCYYIWQHFTEDKEEEYDDLKNLKNALDEYIASQNMKEPTAPPNYYENNNSLKY